MASDTRAFGDLFAEPTRNGLTRPIAVRGAGIKMVNMGELFAHPRLRNAPMDRVPLNRSEAGRFLLMAGDLLFARQSLVLEGAGKCSLFLEDDEPVTFESHVTRVRLDPRVADPQFYFYYLQSHHGRAAIKSIVEQGAGASGIRGSDLARLSVQWRPVSEQRAIAGILGALDDKIELNRRMNRTLEELARALFKAWFVDFEPVRAKLAGRAPTSCSPEVAALFPDRLVPSELGEIPEGWRVGTLGEIIAIHDSKRVPLSSRQREQRRGAFPYYGATGIMDYVDSYLFDGIYILMAEDGSVLTDDGHPVIQYVWGQFWVNNHAHVLTGRRGTGESFLKVMLENLYLRPHVTGAVQLKLNQANMKGIEILVPPRSILATYEKLVAPSMAKYRAAVHETRTLAELHTALLPKLMSGLVRIGEY